MTALVHENTVHNKQHGILAALCVSITKGKKKVWEVISATKSKQHFQQGKRTAN